MALPPSVSPETHVASPQRLLDGQTTALVNLDAGKDAAHKDVGGVEADGAGEAEEGVGDDEHVAEVHDHGDPLGDVQLGVEIEQGVQEQVGCRGSRREVRPPPANGIESILI